MSEGDESMKDVIYMDYQATTPCDSRVLDAMLPYFSEKFGNPHSVTHVMGREALEGVQNARSQVAKLINTDTDNIIFTSGATEANNLVIQGVCRFYDQKKRKIIVSEIEHKCVLESAKAMGRDGFEIILAPVLDNGIVDLNFLEKHINEDTLLVSVMTVNNEIGTIQPIKEISKLCRTKSALFHTDAAQAIGKINVDANDVDFMSISGHKIYGPKGIGALYVAKGLRVKPILFGGGQERGMRSGTLATPLCVGLGKACEIASVEMAEEKLRLTKFKNYFIDNIMKRLPKVYLNGDEDLRIPGCLNFSFEGVEGEGIMLGMPEVCVSSGSACTSATLDPSYVLKALNTRDELAHSSLRIGFGRFTNFEEIQYVVDKLVSVVTRLREMSPLWK